MTIKYFVFLFPLFCISCNKIGVKDTPVAIEKIFGTYGFDLERITLYKDYTYKYSYIRNGVLENEKGIWRYQSFKAISINVIYTYDMRAISDNGDFSFYTEYMTHTFYVCKYWGKIMITKGYEGDPDGAPALKWYKK